MKSMFIRRKNGTNIILKGIELELGKYYHIHWGRNLIKVKLIQVTEYGYNLLNEETNCCVLSHHLYVPKKIREKSDKKFFYISENFSILNI